MKKIILITGGSRSGKSHFAEKRAEEISLKKLYLASCPVFSGKDSEMDARIRLHRKEREGRGWDTVEEELHIEKVLDSATDYDVVLLDCISLWINNLMFYSGEDFSLSKEWLATKLDPWLSNKDGKHSFSGTLIIVTSEVGLGIVPENKVSREYRDLLGWCNQMIAEKADEVYLVSCGLPLQLK